MININFIIGFVKTYGEIKFKLRNTANNSQTKSNNVKEK